MGISQDTFISLYPRLYHMAQAGSWPSIQRIGLRSTTALLNLFEVGGDERFAIESRHRPESVPITHPKYGTAIIRDQKPMSESALIKCLRNTSPRSWYELLNQRVFFWVTEERVNTLLGARAYKKDEHVVLTLDTSSLIRKYADQITLSPINSGSTVYDPKPRGVELFQTFAGFPYDSRRKYGKRAVAELAVNDAVPDVKEFVLRVERRKQDQVIEVLYAG
jgi:hypothetical protein